MASVGWESVFYISGATIILFVVPWWILFVHDTPEGSTSVSCFTTHPSEILHIQSNGNNGGIAEVDPEEDPEPMVEEPEIIAQRPPPFRKLFLNRGVLAFCTQAFASPLRTSHGFIQFSYSVGGWGWYIFLSWMPTYFKRELHFDLVKSGVISFLPYVVRPIVGIISGLIVDALNNRKLVRLVGTRSCDTIPPIMVELFHYSSNYGSSTQVVSSAKFVDASFHLSPLSLL